SSARASRLSGTVRPSVLAVLRPMIGSTFVISWTGKPRRRNATLHGWRKLCRPAQLMSVCLPRAQPAVERESPTFPGDTHLSFSLLALAFQILHPSVRDSWPYSPHALQGSPLSAPRTVCHC